MTGSIFLGSTSYAVNENEATVTITIERTGDLSGAVDVQYATNPDGATEAVDFVDTDGTATIAAGEALVSVTIPIVDDALSETTENFNVSLITVSSGSLLFPRTANVRILDDENPVTDPVDPPKVSDYVVELQDVIGALDQPLNIEWLPGSANLALVVEKKGILKILDTQSETVVSTLLDIRSEVNSNGDRGLMDIALHPDFANNPYLYAYVVVDPADAASQSGNAGLDGGGNRYAHVIRYTVDDSGTLPTIDPASKVILVGGAGQSLADISGGGALNFTDVTHENERASDVDAVTGDYVEDYIKADSQSHVGGALAFGPDGMLYISTGDGVSFDFADGRVVSVQSTDALAGKILRVDPLTGNGLFDNPFVEVDDDLTENSSKIYQTGLRNPYVITFSEDGKLFISETGWFSWEEINQGEAGANFGWPYFEGGDSGILERTPIFENLPTAPAFYADVDAGNIAVTAAYRAFSHLESDPGYSMAAIVGSSSVYTGDQYPDIFQDDYFFLDIVGKDLFSVDTNDRTQLNFLKTLNANEPIVNFAQSPDGFLYVMLFNGSIKKLVITDPNPPQNTAPIVANPIDAQSAAIDSAFDFTLPASTFFDAEGDQLGLSAMLADGSGLPAWLTFNPVTGMFTGTPNANDAGSLAITVSASDPSALTASDVFSLSINVQNEVPILIFPADNQTISPGADLNYTLPPVMFIDDGQFTLSALVSNGDPLPAWLMFDPATGSFSGTPSQADLGGFAVTVTATDLSGQTASDSFGISIEPSGNSAPVAVGMIGDQIVDSGDALSVVLANGLFTDADNDILTLTATLANGDPLPSWLSFNANTATFSGTPMAQDEGVLAVRVISTDPSGESANLDFSIQIDSPAPGAPVTDNPFADQTAVEDVPFNAILPANTFSDLDGDTLTLSATLSNGDPLPSWLSFNAATGSFSGTPAQADAGIHSINVTATDPSGLSTTDIFTVTVNVVNEAPVLATPIANQNATEETAFSLTLAQGTFSDPDGDALTYSVELATGNVLPNWLSFDAVTRILSGTPDDAEVGVLQLSAIATDPSGLSANDNFDLTIGAISDAPTVAAEQADQMGQEGAAFSYTVPAATFTDVDDASLTLSASLSNGDPLPTWLSFDVATGTFTGIPSAADTGTVNVRVTATDAGNLFVTDDLILSVMPASTNETLYNDIAGTTQFLFGTVADTDVFVVNGNVADYSWNDTEDGLGIVVWNASGPDLLYDFDEIRFNDMSISLNVANNEYHDLPGVVQFLTGESANDTFVVSGDRADFNFGATEDGTGVVIWSAAGHDLLYDFENIQFDDETVVLADEIV